MIDWSELKWLGENAIQHSEKIGEHDWYHEHEVRSLMLSSTEDAQFVSAANPEVVLALIAENERLRESDQESTELCDTLSALLGQIAVAVRGPEEPKSRHGFHDLPSRVKTVVTERDQLKAENEELRKDAERYRWLREQGWSTPAEIWTVRFQDKVPVVHVDLDEAIDAAMGKGEQP